MANAFMAGPAGTAAVRVFAEEQRRVMLAEVAQLDKLVEQLTPADEAAPEPAATPTPPRPRKRRAATGKGAVTRSKDAAAKRSQDVLTFLLEHGPAVPAEIREATGITGPKALRAAVQRLEEQGKVRNSGPLKRPVYEAVGGTAPAADPPGAPDPEPEGKGGRPDPGIDSTGQTLAGRILAHIADKNGDGASEGELGSVLEVSVEKVRSECGKLIREGEIRFLRRDGKVVYVEDPSA